FAIGTLALGEILRTTVGNVLPEISTLPARTIASYRLTQRYYLALVLAGISVIVVAALATSRAGLGMRAIREDEEAAEASGVGALSLKLLALALSTALAGLAGGLFAFYHISYYPAHPFGPQWTFDAGARAGGARVIWASAGRGPATRKRADADGLEDVDTLVRLARESEMILSVCPPANAPDVAREVAGTRFGGTFVDGNAIAPA